jgi:hypothetical protein
MKPEGSLPHSQEPPNSKALSNLLACWINLCRKWSVI